MHNNLLEIYLGKVNDAETTRWIENLLLIIAFLQITKELFEIPEKVGDDIAKISAFAASGLTGPVVAVLYGIAIALVRLSYIVGVTAAFVNLSIQCINLIFQPQREYKGCTLYTLLEKAFEFFDYRFVTNIELLKSIVFIPSLPRRENTIVDNILGRVPVTTEGIPSVKDQGFLLQ